jgi:hypothetical protein
VAAAGRRMDEDGASRRTDASAGARPPQLAANAMEALGGGPFWPLIRAIKYTSEHTGPSFWLRSGSAQ